MDISSYCLTPPSALPPGGSPALDSAYERWLHGFVDEANSRWADAWWREHHELPRRELVRTYQLTGHLYKWLLGRATPSGTGLNHNHRIRFVSVQFAFRRAEIVAEADRYLSVLLEEAEARP